MEKAQGVSYALKFEEREGYLYAFVNGEEDSLETSLAVWTAIAAECQTGHHRRVLIEEDFQTQLSPTDMYLFASKLPELFPDAKIAFVDRQSSHDDENRFGELVARNRCVFVRVFPNAHDAQSWLMCPLE